MTRADLANARRLLGLLIWKGDDLAEVEKSMREMVEEIERLRALIGSPSTTATLTSISLEAAHQVERWGVEHDAGKRRQDWITLISYLLGKVAAAHFDLDTDKLKHRVVTIAAACLNWLRAENGEATPMRPGIGET